MERIKGLLHVEFKFLNTKVDLSVLRQGVKIDANNQFLKSYDKNNNSIFDNEELSQLYSDLEPVELRETIIRAFASINSNTRKGAREYNEMYGSNPKDVMAVFTYSVDYTENLGNPVDFLNRTTINPNEQHSFGDNPAKSVSERTEFLRRYALEHNVPFVVFGD